MGVLFPYQEEGARFMAERDAAYNADAPGLGKSAQAVSAALRRGAKSARVICPASLRENWRREFIKFGGGDITLDIMSYEGAVKRWGTETGKTDVLILDEAHYLQGRDTRRTQVVLGKGKESGWRHLSGAVYPLSGTPMRANPSQLWPILHALFPAAISNRAGKAADFWAFVNRFCTVRDNGFGQEITGGKNMEELRQRIAPYFIRRTKEEGLKELIVGTVTVEQKTLSRDLRGLEKEWAPRLAEALASEDEAALASLAPHAATLRKLIGLAKVGPTLDLLMEELLYGEKIVVFAWHREVLDEMEARLRQENIGLVRIDGSTLNRQQKVDAFQKDPECRVFLGNILAAGTGLTLTAARSLLMLESSWTPADNAQAIKRIHRIGQTASCLARYVALAGSIDERLAEVCAKKTKTISQLGM